MTSISIGGLAIPNNLFFEAEDLNKPAEMKLKCATGMMTADPDYTKFGIIENKVSAIFTFNMYDSTCNNNENFLKALNGSCTG